jgi:ring-1,2-phenylacetyl-CoA epoxidase subunit PaaA
VQSWSSLEEFEAFLDEGGIVEPNDAMPDEYRHQVFRFIELHANSELMGGLTERDFVPRAPGMQRKLGTLAKTQDELGHAHHLYMVAADLAIKTRDEMLSDLYAGRTRFHNVFHYRVHTWADQVAIAYLVDAAALTTQQAVFKRCSYGPYRRILRRVIAEEGFHMRQGEEMLLRLAEGTPQQHDMFQEALERWWEPVMHFFGPPSKKIDLLLRWHIKSASNEELRDRYVQKFVPQLLSYGFAVPDPGLHQDPGTGKWIVGDIDWSALSRTRQNVGPDSARRIATARAGFEAAAWVREGLETAALHSPAVA